MKTACLAALLASMVTQAFANDCDVACIEIYSFDEENCTCVPIAMMECHPQYNADSEDQSPGCNQKKEDVRRGRDPDTNPFKTEEWYEKSLLVESAEGKNTSNGDDTSASDEAELAYLIGTKASIVILAMASLL